MIYLAWTDASFAADLPGPWSELHLAADGLVFVDSDDTPSRVYHELKWSLPANAAIVVAPVSDLPKLRGVGPGTLTWLRQRNDIGARDTRRSSATAPR